MPVTDTPFESTPDVGSIQYRLHPIDVGFDLREDDLTVNFAYEPTLRVSYPDKQGGRRVMHGPINDVLERLEQLGFSVAVVSGDS